MAPEATKTGLRVRVGLVVNPAASRDVRRLTSLARTVDVHERVNVVARVLRGLAAVGVDDVLYMVEPCHVAERAWTELANAPVSVGRTPSLRPISVPPATDALGTKAAASALSDEGVPCVVCIGGDGTHRAVAAGWPDVVLAAVAGGTNNVFGPPVDPTVVGLAAGLYAADPRRYAHHVRIAPRLDVEIDGVQTSAALVDVAVVDEPWVGAHAVWDPAVLVEAVVTRSDPTACGLAGVGGMVHPIVDGEGGLHLWFGDGEGETLAPLGPGQLAMTTAPDWSYVLPGDEVTVGGGSRVTLAFDGEREIVLQPAQVARVCLNANGPRVLDMAALVWEAAAEGVFARVRGATTDQEGRA